MLPARLFKHSILPCTVAALLWGALAPAAAQPRSARATASYEPPDVTLVDANGAAVGLRALLAGAEPVLLQFIFTSCPTICPVMSSLFAAAQHRLRAEGVRLLSISIDPEHDTPARLRAHARKFKAGRNWRLLTGKPDEILAVQKAFDAYRGNKMSHEPATYLRLKPGASWVRFDGLLSAGELVAEYQRLKATARHAAAGARIYRAGLLPSGRPLRAVAQGDLTMEGTHLACATCHRRSGFGASEGGQFVPPVTGPALWQAGAWGRNDRVRWLVQEVRPAAGAPVQSLPARPAYTEQALARALRAGLDPVGRALDPLMPRYQLRDEEAAGLIAYLKELSAVASPGVTASALHFATVITEGVAPAQRQAMLDVLAAYFRWKNTETRGTRLVQSQARAPAAREWVLHVWTLQGPAASWPAQLERYYRAQPVFALLSGIGSGAWRPVHDFCERAQLPCLFPHTDLPVTDNAAGHYSRYFSRGLVGQAEALAHHLREQTELGAAPRIVQVYRGTDDGVLPARALRQALRAYGGTRLYDRAVAPGQPLTPAAWRKLCRELRPAALVLWLPEADLATLAAAPPPVRRIYLAAGLLRDLPRVSEAAWRAQLYFSYPFALTETPHVYRVRAWLRARGIARGPERLQLNTWLALTIADHALAALGEYFFRDYFLENVAHETENAPRLGVFPRLSLGPGQRFAAKGSYIIKPASAGADSWEAVGDWIVP